MRRKMGFSSSPPACSIGAIPADVKAFDRVVAADVLYEEHHSTALASVIARTLAHNGVAFVADPCRAKAASFEEACRKVGLDVCKKKPVGRWARPTGQLSKSTA